MTPLPPGPRLPAAAQTLLFTASPVRFMERCFERYGDAFTVRLAGLGGPSVFLADPEAIKKVFTGDPAHLRAGEGNAFLRPLMGRNSLLLLDEQEHLRQRRLMLPAFHGERLAKYRELIATITEREVAQWPVGRPFALRPRTLAITLAVIMRAVFGLEEGERLDRLQRPLCRVIRLAFGPGAAVLGFLGREGRFARSRLAPWSVFRRAMDEADALIFEEIRDRRSDPASAERDDVLSLLLRVRDEDGRAMTDVEIRDELMTMLVAGHETTATALAWAFEELLHEPSTLARLEQAVTGGDDVYVEAVIKETLRLRPIAPLVGRKLTVPMEIKGRLVPAGTLLAPCIYLTHRLPDVYPEPLRFRPERFLEDAPDTYSWIPFGGGVRRCLGASFAMFEMKVVIPTILRRVRLAAADGSPDRVKRASLLLMPARGTRVTVEEQRDEAWAGSAVPVAAG